MLYRATLLAISFDAVFGGGAVADRALKYRREVNMNTEDAFWKLEDTTGTKYAKYCSGDLTPDFIQSCVYTDCFVKGGPNGAHNGLTRRRTAAFTGPFPNIKGAGPDCTVTPTAPNPCGVPKLGDARKLNAECSMKNPTKWEECTGPDSRANPSTLGDSLGKTPVCSYATPTPTGTGKNGQETCQCKTVRCTVVVKEDKTTTAAGYTTKGTGASEKKIKDQKLQYAACNFIVRIEDTHATPSVPKWIMWVIFGLSIFVAGSVSAFFICLYGNKSHSPEGEEREDSNE